MTTLIKVATFLITMKTNELFSLLYVSENRNLKISFACQSLNIMSSRIRRKFYTIMIMFHNKEGASFRSFAIVFLIIDALA